MPWLDLSRVNWTRRQSWDTGTALTDSSGNESLQVYHLIPLVHRGATFGAVLVFAPAWRSDAQVDAILQRFALAWYHLQRGVELTHWHTHDARRLGAIADTTAILGEPDLDRLLAELLEMSLAMVGAEVGCVALCEEDGSTTVRAWRAMTAILAWSFWSTQMSMTMIHWRCCRLLHASRVPLSKKSCCTRSSFVRRRCANN